MVGDRWWVVGGADHWLDLGFQYLVHRQAWHLPELVRTVHQIYAGLDVLHWVELMCE